VKKTVEECALNKTCLTKEIVSTLACALLDQVVVMKVTTHFVVLDVSSWICAHLLVMKPVVKTNAVMRIWVTASQAVLVMSCAVMLVKEMTKKTATECAVLC